MKISDLIKLSFDNLKRRKGRTLLTVLGVIIGTCSIVMMVSIGVALDKSYDEMLQGWGDLTLIEVYSYGSGETKLTDAVVDEFLTLPNVTVATPIYSPDFSMYFVSGNNDKYMGWANIKAMRKDAIERYGYEILEGDFPTGNEKNITVLVGEEFAYQFENTKKKWPDNYVDYYEVDENGNHLKPLVDVFHDKIQLKSTFWDDKGNDVVIYKDITVSGVLKEDWSKGYETAYGVIMDIEDVIALEEEMNKAAGVKTNKKEKERTYSQAIVKVRDMDDVDEVNDIIKDMGFSTYSMASFRDELKKETMTIELILGGLGGIAMLVSAISIANTMTMAIYERTKEIGVMKVLGCELRDIKNMFLSEARAIGFLGGMTGIIICYGLSTVMNAVAGGYLGGTKISIIPVWLALFGLGFSTLVGIISGYIPAVKAVKVTALSAIRHE